MNNSFRFTTNTSTAFLIRDAAIRQGRTVADVIRRAVEQHVEAPTAADDCAVTDHGPRRRGGSGRMTGCYLNGPLAQIVRDIAEQEGRSHSNVVRNLLRQALRDRGLMSSPSSAPVEA